jgi:hypothetical protein
MSMHPRWLLRIEGVAMFGLAAFFYGRAHFGWGWYALLFLAPDLSILGYLANGRAGAALYNLVHTSTVPLCGLLVAMALPAPRIVPFVLIWISHIGFDRLLGFGLKYPTKFRDTHLQRV